MKKSSFIILLFLLASAGIYGQVYLQDRTPLEGLESTYVSVYPRRNYRSSPQFFIQIMHNRRKPPANGDAFVFQKNVGLLKFNNHIEILNFMDQHGYELLETFQDCDGNIQSFMMRRKQD